MYIDFYVHGYAMGSPYIGLSIPLVTIGVPSTLNKLQNLCKL